MTSKTKNTERLEQQAIDLYTEQKFADERLRSVLIGAMIGTVPLYQCERFRAEYLARQSHPSTEFAILSDGERQRKEFAGRRES